MNGVAHVHIYTILLYTIFLWYFKKLSQRKYLLVRYGGQNTKELSCHNADWTCEFGQNISACNWSSEGLRKVGRKTRQAKNVWTLIDLVKAWGIFHTEMKTINWRWCKTNNTSRDHQTNVQHPLNRLLMASCFSYYLLTLFVWVVIGICRLK